MTGRRALVITEPGSIALQGVHELVPGPGEVVARPVHTGICGTDLELLAAWSIRPTSATRWSPGTSGRA